MLDGTTLQANPLGLKDGRFTRSMDRDELGIERSGITYISIVAASLPPAPTGKVKKDRTVLLDGTRSFGQVKVKEIKFSAGTILQNGKEMTLENVACIRYAHPLLN